MALKIAMLLVGLVLAVTGVWIYFYAVTATGIVLGGIGGFLVAGWAANGELLAQVVFVIVGAMVGVGLVWAYLKFVVMFPGFVLGAAGTIAVLGDLIPTDFMLWGALAGGAVGALVAWMLFELLVAVLTAFVGATFVWAGIQPGGAIDVLLAAIDITSLLEGSLPLPWVFDPVFLGTFGVGLVVQVGGRYFGLTRYLPASVTQVLPADSPGGALDESAERDTSSTVDRGGSAETAFRCSSCDELFDTPKQRHDGRCCPHCGHRIYQEVSHPE